MGINPIEALGGAEEQPGESGPGIEQEVEGGTPTPEGKPGASDDEEVLPPPGEGEEFPTFYDASKVREELRPTFKEMQAGLTKKFQEVAQMKRELQGSVEQAGLLRALLADEEVVRALDAIRIRRQGGTSEEGEGGGEEVEESGSSTDPRLRKLEQRLAKYEQDQAEAQMRQQINRERDAFVARYPDWEKYGEWMRMAWQQDQNLSMVGAYHEGRKLHDEYRDSLQRKQAGIKTVERPSTPATGRKPSSKQAESWYEAAEQAKAELGLDDRY